MKKFNFSIAIMLVLSVLASQRDSFSDEAGPGPIRRSGQYVQANQNFYEPVNLTIGSSRILVPAHEFKKVAWIEATNPSVVELTIIPGVGIVATGHETGFTDINCSLGRLESIKVLKPAEYDSMVLGAVVFHPGTEDQVSPGIMLFRDFQRLYMAGSETLNLEARFFPGVTERRFR